MLLRVSSETQGKEVDLLAVRDSAVDSGVPHSVELTTFAEAAVRGSREELEAARNSLQLAMGAEAVVEAAAVVGNFEHMVRIADGTGIPLDKPVAVFSVDLRAELGIDEFGTAAHTPEVGPLLRTASRLAQPLLKPIMRLYGRGSR